MMKKIFPAVTLGLASIAATAILASPATAEVTANGHASPVQVESKTPEVRNVILVHGALADGSGWQGVYDRLVAKGYNVSIVQEPETSLADDVAATRRAIAMQDGPVVLVGHSYGGEVITQAGDDPKVKALVYVAAAVPDIGESLNNLFERIPSPTHDIKPTDDGYLMLDPQKFHADFAADLPARQADFMAKSQVLVAAEVFDTPVTTAAWKTKPSYGIVAGKDLIASPDLERWMYTRAHAKITEVPESSHAVYISHPDKVASVIEEAAGR
ncbi:alpha/beta fold hydrolase [Streptomyces canus]|uniref:alpha/beta fold hydrolase n=1 Tax=Streptomyces canus TaxID=58343 RepID=UPI000366BF4D|nr:alpha/beta hydrolase [Streptomyces canus]